MPKKSAPFAFSKGKREKIPFLKGERSEVITAAAACSRAHPGFSGNTRLRTSAAAVALTLAFLGASVTAQAASFDCSWARTYAETTICSDPDLNARDTELGRTIEEVRSIFEEDDKAPLRLRRKLENDRSFCFTKACIEDWYAVAEKQWELFLDASRDNRGEEALEVLLKRRVQVSDLQYERDENFIAAARRECRKGGKSSSAGCFAAAFEEVKTSDSYLDLACQRQTGEPSAIACSLLGTDLELGSRGKINTKKSLEYLKKGCELESSAACLSLGDWYLANRQHTEAAHAYRIAARFGSDLGRMAEFEKDPDLLTSKVKSEPTPAEVLFFHACNAPYGASDETTACLTPSKRTTEQRLIRSAKDAGASDSAARRVADAVRKRSNTIFNLVQFGLGADVEARAAASVAAAESYVSVARNLAMIASGSSEELFRRLQIQCDDNCETLEMTKDYVAKQEAMAEDSIKYMLGEGPDAKELRETLRWFKNMNHGLAEAVTKEIEREDSVLVEALTLTDFARYWQTATAK